MSSKPLFAAALVALSLGLAACGDSGSDSTTGAETSPSAQEETSPPAQVDEGADETTTGDNEIVPEDESEAAPSGEAAKSEKVDIVEFTYQPDPVVVQAGGKVIWQNQDVAPHTATAEDESWNTGTIEKGKIGSETFKQAGTFAYFCEIHPDMRGTVEVVE